MIKKVVQKLIISGHILDLFKYKSPYYVGSSQQARPPRPNSSVAALDKKIINRQKSAWRSRSKVRRTLNTNAGYWYKEDGAPYPPVFLTLTHARRVTQPDEANEIFTLYIQRMNYHLYGKRAHNLKYLANIEFTKKDRIHNHLAIFNMPYLHKTEFQKIWGQGFIKVRAVDSVDNIGAYICKYMGKNLDDPRLAGRKCYFPSMGLKKPIEIIDPEQIKNILKDIPAEALKYHNIFGDEFGTEYTQYNIGQYKDINSISIAPLKELLLELAA